MNENYNIYLLLQTKLSILIKQCLGIINTCYIILILIFHNIVMRLLYITIIYYYIIYEYMTTYKLLSICFYNYL